MFTRSVYQVDVYVLLDDLMMAWNLDGTVVKTVISKAGCYGFKCFKVYFLSKD